ncbi:hypothetical protein [Burkholderia phage BCSR5]|nr:hypothetical protein [Burkholderia phage BCSR5]
MYSFLVLSDIGDNNDKDFTWVKNVEKGFKGKQMRNGYELPEGTWTESPGEIVNRLKQHSKDYDEAQRRVNFYTNRAGRNLRRNGDADELRMDQTKKALKDAYGIKDKPKTEPKENKPKDPNKANKPPKANTPPKSTNKPAKSPNKPAKPNSPNSPNKPHASVVGVQALARLKLKL